MDPDNRPGPPHNAKEAFTMEGDQVYSVPTFRYYSSNQDKAKFLTSNVQADIHARQAELNERIKTIGQLQQQKVHIDADIQQNVREERKSETQLMKIREAKRKASMEMGELKNIEDPTPVDVSTLEEEVVVLEKHIKVQQEHVTEKQAVYQEQDTKLTEIDKTYLEIQQRMMQKLQAGEAIESEVASIVNEVEVSKGHKKHYDGQLKEHDNKVQELRQTLEKHKQEVDEVIDKASRIHSDRINTRRSTTNLESEINQTKKHINSEERQRGDPDEIAREYKKKRDSFFVIKKDVKQLQLFCEQLDMVVAKRLRRFKVLRRMISMRAKYYFITQLSNRKYSGKMTINHQQERLDMNVEPTKTGEGDLGAKDINSLSGGERSFSTVCFILALWDTMESPFRCLDEFDVFMDMVNRRITMSMMMKMAESQPDHQFIFFSPLDMSMLDISRVTRLKIFRMPDPDTGQGQSVLPFRPANESQDDAEEN